MKKVFLSLIAFMLSIASAISQEKIDLSLLNGEWITPGETAYFLKIQAGEAELKVSSDVKPNQQTIYKETQYPKFATEIKLKSGETYVYTITVVSPDHVLFYDNISKKETQWFKKGIVSTNESGEFFAHGKKLGKVIKTKKANLLLSTIPEFTVYDVNNVPRILFEGVNGNFMFLDDRKSYIPRKVDAHADQIGEFFAYDSLFTPSGYNDAYKARFIKKYSGFNASGSSERNYNDALRFDGFQVYQGDALVGSFDSYKQDDGTQKYVIKTAEGKPVSVILVEKAQSNQTRVLIYDTNQKQIATLPDSYDNQFKRHEEGIKWLVKNRFL